MASYYVRSGAGGAGTGADWANAYTTLAAAFSGKAAGDVFYVSEDHAETQASAMSLTSPGTATAPVKVICVNHTGSVPPVSADIRATATVTTTGTSNLSFAGADSFTIFDGIIFSAGTGGSAVNLTIAASSRMSVKFRNCALRNGCTQNGGRIFGGGNSLGGCRVELENTTMQFGATGHTVSYTGEFLWRNTASAITGATLPTVLFTPLASTGYNVQIDGVDLSAITGTIVSLPTGVMGAEFKLADCKINASATIASTPVSRGAGIISYNRLDSGGTNYKFGRVRYEGTLTEETTIVRTGGASNGVTPISYKIVTTANCSEHFPFECPAIAVWNSTTGSAVTATVEGIWGGGAVPNDDEIWIEAEYLGSNASPQASFVNDSKADILASAAGQTSSSETWGGSTTKFKMSVTFTPQQAGWVLVRVKAAKPSSTFYIDPKLTLS